MHGWAFSSQAFGSLQGIKIDLPGHGKSLNVPYQGLEKIAENLARKITSKVDIVGWSLGGSIAIILALNYPSKVNRLILIASTANFYSCWESKSIRGFLIRLTKEGHHFLKEFRVRAFKALDIPINIPTAKKMLEDFIYLDLRSILHKIDKETYILQAYGDDVVPFKCGKTLHKLIKNSKFIPLAGGHLPKGYERVILEILKS